MAKALATTEELYREATLPSGAVLMMWCGARGTVYVDGHQMRVEWPWGPTYYATWDLMERFARGSVVLV
jgi:hypothetical protein